MFNNKVIILTTFVLITLTGCNMFDEKTYVCKDNKDTSNALTGLRIKTDSVILSGNYLYKLVGQNIKICKKGSKRYISEDELSFTNDNCDNDEMLKNEKTSGRFNFITKRLNLNHTSPDAYFELDCEKNKNN